MNCCCVIDLGVVDTNDAHDSSLKATNILLITVGKTRWFD